jgi:hypothetical protein
MAEDKAAVEGTALMWALSKDKRTVRLTVPAASGDSLTRMDFDRYSLEAPLSMLVQMHFEMTRTAPAKVPYVKH